MTVFHRVTEGKLGSRDGCVIEDEVSQEFLDRIPGGLFRYRADDEGGTVVPARMRTIPASEFGAVTVSEPGLYALCAGDISSPSATVLVNATEDGPADVTVRV